MTCSPGVILPRTILPGVWSRFARELRISLFLLEISENHRNQVKFKIFSDRWMIEFQQSSFSNKACWSILCHSIYKTKPVDQSYVNRSIKQLCLTPTPTRNVFLTKVNWNGNQRLCCICLLWKKTLLGDQATVVSFQSLSSFKICETFYLLG